MLRRLAALTGLSAAALLAMTPAANADQPTDDGVGLTYGVTTAAIDAGTGVAGGALEIAGLDRR
jgi:hypothetical protein